MALLVTDRKLLGFEGLCEEVCNELIEMVFSVASLQAVCLICVDLHKQQHDNKPYKHQPHGHTAPLLSVAMTMYVCRSVCGVLE